MSGRGGDLNYANFKCITYRVCCSVKSQPSFPLKDGELRGDMSGDLLVMFIFLYMHTVSGQIPHVYGTFWCEINVMPYLSLSIGWEGVVGHNIDKRINS